LDRLPSQWLSGALGTLVGLMIAALLVAVAWFVYERWKLRRRASRIGLDVLPVGDQMRLARQLGFYDDLMRLLERRQIIRPKHLTPLEFSDSLAYLPSEVYDSIHRLTHIFYRIRYGHAELQGSQRRRLAKVIERVETAMSGQAT
ncbi:MAG: DUF4129 domain-containing protein, partial [Tepidisphaeraceae bacterium]